jgi:AcrR family transcriptional regulator
MNRLALQELPLRERKRARTRIALVEALLERLAERPLEDIQVAELVGDADISAATFFNYFPTKADLLTHFIQLWSLQVSALARDVEARHESALAAIEALFMSAAEQTVDHPRVMLEIIVHLARTGLQPSPIERAERLMYLPEVEDVESLPDTGLSGILPDLLAKAVARGELPAHTDIEGLMQAVWSVFFGVPLFLGGRHPEAVATIQRQQLHLLWAGAKAKEA